MHDNGSEEIIPFLKSSELFQDFSEGELTLLISFVRFRTFNEGDWIIKEGEVGQNLYLIKTGRVEIVKKDEEYNSYTRLEVLGPGEWVGEMAFFEQEKRSASIRALGKVEVVILMLEDLRASEQEEHFYPKIIKQLSKRISQRLRKTDDSLIVSLTEKLKLVKASNQASDALIHIMIWFALFINLAKVLALHAKQFPVVAFVFPTLSILVFGVSSAWLIRKSDYPLSFYGLTTHKWFRHTIEAIAYTIPLLILVTLIKYVLIHTVSDFKRLDLFVFTQKGKGFYGYIFLWVMYLVFVPVQELTARSFLQSCFRNIFHGKYRAFFAILTSNLLFEMAHTIEYLSFAISTFCFGIFWGYLFEKQQSIVGACVSHAILGAWVFFALDYDPVFAIIG